MFSAIRQKFSGDKTRFSDGKYDLDLTYITDRIIAMAFPGNGMEGTYRNRIMDVASMFRNYHGGHYRIYNLSGRSYDTGKFDKGSVQTWCAFPDHNPPPLETMLALMSNIHAYLSADPRNVVAIHCLAGKGRTGTIISSYMIYSGLFVTAGDSLRYFAHKRSATVSGVSYPGQLRYVMYGQRLFDRVNPLKPKKAPVFLHTVTLSHIPKLSLNVMNTSFGITPVLEVFYVSHNKLYGQGVTPLYSSAWANTTTTTSSTSTVTNGDTETRTRTTSSSSSSSPPVAVLSSTSSEGKVRTSLPQHLTLSSFISKQNGGSGHRSPLASPTLSSSPQIMPSASGSLSSSELETYNYDTYKKPLEFRIDKAIRGDILITLSHYPSSPTSRCQQVFRLNFHTGYLDLVSGKGAPLPSSGIITPTPTSQPQSQSTSISVSPPPPPSSSSPLQSLSSTSEHESQQTSSSLPKGVTDDGSDEIDPNGGVRTAVFRKCDIDCAHESRRFPWDFEVTLTYRVKDFPLSTSESRAFERTADAEEAVVNAALKTVTNERPVGETCFFDPSIDHSLYPNISAKVRMARSEMLSCPSNDGGVISGGGGGGSGGADRTDDVSGGASFEKTGWLTKQGEKVKSWKKRWFVLRSDAIYYYGSLRSKSPKGTIPLRNIMAVVATTQPMDSTHVHCFEVVVSKTSSVTSPPSMTPQQPARSTSTPNVAGSPAIPIASAASTAASATPSPSSSSSHGLVPTPSSLAASSPLSGGDKFSIRSYYICAESEEEKMDWVEAIELARGEGGDDEDIEFI